MSHKIKSRRDNGKIRTELSAVGARPMSPGRGALGIGPSSLDHWPACKVEAGLRQGGPGQDQVIWPGSFDARAWWEPSS